MPYYRNLGNQEGDQPHAEEYYRHCISLPVYPTLTLDEQFFVTESIIKFYR